jgi:hypothetical protein
VRLRASMNAVEKDINLFPLQVIETGPSMTCYRILSRHVPWKDNEFLQCILGIISGNRTEIRTGTFESTCMKFYGHIFSSVKTRVEHK